MPVDPTNNSSSRLYYTYTTDGGTNYEFTAVMESARYKPAGQKDVITPDGGSLASVYEKGSQLGLEPLDYGDSSLVGYWTLDEGTGTVAYDYSGNSNAGNWAGTPAGSSGYYSSGKVGNWAAAFAYGDNDVVTVNTSTVLNMSGRAFTLSFWTQVATTTGFFMISADSAGCSDLAEGYEIDGTGGTAASAQYKNPGKSYSAVSATNLALNTWTYLTQVVDGSADRIYVNGTLSSSTAISGFLTFIQEPLNIGLESCGDYFHGGLIDDVRLYNRALSADEVAAMYKGAK